ncbi:hypothetical protein [Stutzerimonas nitrititolerans]|uniref:Uncharacterized protein n=1 Tax=Stutzerimonas nitrititolerans TaxID=2482751 RepID=A0AA41WF16_9GAMM|nr:hypothetical protein [Stutzerimonas nitrititolerans]MCO7543272.1 hypothetical protein [Stutzerimonas nitrititolerans]
MADLESTLLLFPHRPKPPTSPATSREPVLAEAELRADIVRNLLEQIAGPDGYYPQDLRLKTTVYAAQGLLDEMVVLYRRALGAGAAHG